MLDKAPNGKVSDLLNALDKALSAGDVERAVDLFQTDCYWRDLVTFTWSIKTMEGKDQVRDMLEARLADTKPSNWKIADGEDAYEADGINESWIQFETAVARGFGHIRLKSGQIWTLLTTMSELKGHEEPLGFDRPMGAKHGAERNRKTWKEEGGAEEAERGTSRQQYWVIIGGGQGGIGLGARIRQLDVPTIIIEKNERPGDSWRNRYKSLSGSRRSRDGLIVIETIWSLRPHFASYAMSSRLTLTTLRINWLPKRLQLIRGLPRRSKKAPPDARSTWSSGTSDLYARTPRLSRRSAKR